MRACVFVGPTLRAEDLAPDGDIVVLPPVAQGDVYRAAQAQPSAIGIVDGYFEGALSVWHKEILWAMVEGIHVFGSASMGALRAAELHPFGMRGIGRIFEAFRDGELEGFTQQAAEMMRLTREKDTRTLRYDWFLSNDGTQCEVREGYVDADGLLEHANNVGEARAKLFRDFAYGHDMTIYGEPSPALAEAMEALAGVVQFNRFSLLQGLDVDIEVPDEVTA